MTIIVAVQYRDKVLFGADSQVTAGNGRAANHPQMVKISQKQANYIIAGRWRMCALRYCSTYMGSTNANNAKDWNDLVSFHDC
jgi:hypothetical protein